MGYPGVGTFSVKGLIVNIFTLWPYGLSHDYCTLPSQGEGTYRGYVSELDKVCANKTLLTK